MHETRKRACAGGVAYLLGARSAPRERVRRGVRMSLEGRKADGGRRRGGERELPALGVVVFGGLVVRLLFLDLFVLHRSARKIPFRESLRFTGF